jgi:hypothetical protein
MSIVSYLIVEWARRRVRGGVDVKFGFALNVHAELL